MVRLYNPLSAAVYHCYQETRLVPVLINVGKMLNSVRYCSFFLCGIMLGLNGIFCSCIRLGGIFSHFLDKILDHLRLIMQEALLWGSRVIWSPHSIWLGYNLLVFRKRVHTTTPLNSLLVKFTFITIHVMPLEVNLHNLIQKQVHWKLLLLLPLLRFMHYIPKSILHTNSKQVSHWKSDKMNTLKPDSMHAKYNRFLGVLWVDTIAP